MPARSQRPLVAKLLALEPLRVNDHTYTSLDAALADMGVHHSADQLVAALWAADVDVSRRTLYQWKGETDVD